MTSEKTSVSIDLPKINLYEPVLKVRVDALFSAHIKVRFPKLCFSDVKHRTV